MFSRHCNCRRSTTDASASWRRKGLKLVDSTSLDYKSRDQDLSGLLEGLTKDAAAYLEAWVATRVAGVAVAIVDCRQDLQLPVLAG